METRSSPVEVRATENLNETIIDVVADLDGVDPVELTPPLYSVIDPDALESLFASTNGDAPPRGHVSFRYRGYDVRVSSDGPIEILNR